ncbi:MAG: hypothetical protein QXH88_00775 [Sulfolobales archaeon]
MSESRFYLRVAEDFLTQARKALNLGITSLSALSLVLAVKNSALSIISCFKPPLVMEDVVIELKFLNEEHLSAFENLRQRLEEFTEISQYIIYTYLNVLMHGDFATGKTPSEVLSLEELSDLVEISEKAVRIAEWLIEVLRCSQQ